MTISESYAKFITSYGHLSRMGILLMLYMISRQTKIVDLKEFMEISGCRRSMCYKAKKELNQNGITFSFTNSTNSTKSKKVD